MTHAKKQHTPHISPFGKIPPQSTELEYAVIGACLIEPDAYATIEAIIPSHECFYNDAHQKVYRSMQELNHRGSPIDLLTVTEELRRKGELELIGGAYELIKLSQAVLSSAHIETHARIIMEKFFAREIIRIGASMVAAAYDETNDPLELIEVAKFQIETVTKDIAQGEDLPIGRIYSELLKEIEIQKNNPAALTGVDTGLTSLNEVTNGWQKQDLIIIGARPSKGKTALALNLALSAAISTLVQNVPVGIFSLEMSSTQLVKRLASTVSGVDFGNIMSGKLSDDEFVKISQKSRYFNGLPIRISDKVFSLAGICQRMRNWKDKHDIGLVVIDYLQLIKGKREQNGNREQEIANISRELKLVAKELDIPIILLSQLNRTVESRSVQEPQLSDLRESGAIEQDADVIIFPWHDKNANTNQIESYITVAKNRNGKTAMKDDKLLIKFAGSIQKWMDANAFEPFKETYNYENARAGIGVNYQKSPLPFDDDAPF